MDAAGVLTDQYLYSPYGVEEPLAGSGNLYRYTGRYYDAETGLYYYRARYYDPSPGRFLSPDPILYAGGLNLYGYVGGNPINNVDPLGLIESRTGALQDCPDPDNCDLITVTGQRPPDPEDALFYRNDFLANGSRAKGNGHMQKIGEFIISCGVANLEGSFGAQAGAKLGIGKGEFRMLGATALIDAGTFRASFGTESLRRGTGRFGRSSGQRSIFDINATQSAVLTGGIGIPGTDLGIEGGFAAERRGSVGRQPGPPGTRLPENSFSINTPQRPFIGLDTGGALLFGFNVQIGFNVPANGSCF